MWPNCYFLVNLFTYLFICFFAVLGLHCCMGFSPVVMSGRLLSSCGMWASHCNGFSCCGAGSLGHTASVAVVHGLSSCSSQALEHRLSTCGTWAWLCCGIWDSSRIRDQTCVCPTLAGGFSTTEPPGQPQEIF